SQFRSIPRYTEHDKSIDLSSNSYLSLQSCDEIQRKTAMLIENHHWGNLASRLVEEHSPLFCELENEICNWKETETALLFNSGYAANLGIISAVCSKDTEVFCDRLNHASIYDGIILSGCKLNRYSHNDMSDLNKRLEQSVSKEKMIITDTVFSMDGDRAPLCDICELAKKHNAMVMVDEAHAAGIFGKQGNGIANEQGVGDFIDIKMGTLSKAVAGLGGFFAGSSILKDYFVNHCRSLIYSTALPHSVLAFNLASIRFIRNNPQIGKKLLHLSQRFRTSLKEIGCDTLNSTTQIIPFVTGDEDEAIALSGFLRQYGIIVPAIRPPTVPKQSARLRFSVHLGFDEQQQDFVIDKLLQWKKQNG
ncbi:MAG TPA: aminotransferase class I/II-fold pyridoxal phosphate-dependent enzyme, partial [Chitinispirillaceae bacterium]|nr:aminotransferase class I/II-fold pyridoxal phosphate-dependent enzyme [Chitinispirillaceae bacterium]